MTPPETHENIYQRQAIVLPQSVNIGDLVPPNPVITEKSMWVPQTEIDLRTALAEGCPVIFRLLESSDAPTTGESDLFVYTATLIGYDTETQSFIARDGKQCFNIAFKVILDSALTGNFWIV